jgi:hypothetical protein
MAAGATGAVVGSVIGNASVPLLEHLGLRFHGILGAREKRRVLTVLEFASIQIE